ncbi:MAG: type IV secretory system conjugative DNA transfer family protein [Patescibacteria group bacterium]
MAPQEPYNPARVTYIGETDHRNKRVKFGIKAKDRTRHIYVIGKTGVGKSVLLENMAVQDIQNGEGFAFIDPHGKTADLLLNYIPEHRLNDVLYFAPFDLEHPVAFNVMEDIGPDKRHLVAAGLMSAFKKIWVDAWSARMEYILNNTILALLEYPGSTLLGINRMLADKEYRKLVVSHVTDPGVKSFWEDEFANYTERFAQEATPAIQNKVGQFTANPVIRNIIGQAKSTFNIREMMDQKKIIIINLSKGQIGEDSASLLGSMLITKIYLAAMSRADLTEKELNKLPNFYLYVDEFQSFANESFANILSEARKYKLNLTMAHQYIEQMSDEVRAAVFGNVGTMLTFRVGATDAEYLEKEFAPVFTAEDLVNLDKYQVYLKLMIDDIASSPFSARTLPPIELPTVSYRDVAIGRSQEQFARPRQAIEEDIIQWHKKSFGQKREGEREGGGGGRSEVPRREGGAPRQGGGERRPERSERRPEGAENRGGMSGGQRRFEAERAPQKKAEDREAEVRKAMSLDKLRQENREEQRRAKGPTPQHVAELRDALAAVLGDAGVQAATQNIQPKEQKREESKPVQEKRHEPKPTKVGSDPTEGGQTPQTTHGKLEDRQKEVPEHVLKKLFEREGK